MRVAFAVLLFLLLSAVPAGAHTSTLTNDYRSAHERARLPHAWDLHDYAQSHAERMAREGRLFHSTSGDIAGLNCWDAIGENVGRGSQPRTIYDAFLRSPAHRDVLLHRRWDQQAIGVAYRDGTVYIAVLFRDVCDHPT